MVSCLVMALDYVLTFLEAFWLFFHAEHFLQRRKYLEAKGWRNSLFPLFCIALYMIVVLSMNQIELTSPYTAITGIGVAIMLVVAGWGSDPIEAIGVGGCYFLIYAMESYPEIAIIGYIGGDALINKCYMEVGIERLIYLIIGGSIWSFMNLMFSIAVRKLRPHVSVKIRSMVVILIGLIGIFFIHWFVFYNFNIPYTLVGFIVSLCMITGFLFLYYRSKMRENALLQEQAEYRNRLMEQRYEELQAFYAANARSYHDMKNHLSTLQHMLQEGKGDEAKAYIDHLEGPLKRARPVVWTGIELIDIILNDKKERALQNGLDMQIDAVLVNGVLQMEKTDICALFANALDNAVEGAAKLIQVKIRETNGLLLLTIQNDLKEQPVRKGSAFVSRKQDQKQHGWGIESMKTVVQKAGGTIDFQVEKNRFLLSCTLLVK